CLGVPLCGSGAAAGLARWPAASLWLGRSADLLRRGCVTWPATVEVGMIAGALPRGLGVFVARFDDANDGTVSVAETRMLALADHVVIDASHSGLLFSAEAAAQAIAFLRNGRFPV
ncbi:MAG: alpha/beta hydrolase, partial [Casimicrobiaceae bacterium]